MKKYFFVNFSIFLLFFAFSYDFPTDFEIPLCPARLQHKDHFVSRKTYYTICYREKFEQPEWVAYHLPKSHLEKNVKRSENFRSDSFIPTKSAMLEDYRRSGFDRGHLAPAADFTFDELAMSETFLLSNMSPQRPYFNRGIWAKLEGKVRYWAKKFDGIFVVTGPILDKDNFETIGPNKVAVPEFYYKVLIAEKRDKTLCGIAFILKNEQSDAELKSFAVSIDAVEHATSIDFFPSLNAEDEKNCESQIKLSDWFD